jgi:hypothetical protein
MLTQLQSDDLSILIAGVFALGIGSALVVGYNSWTLDYRGLVTLLGWVSLIKGIAIIFVPGYLERFAKLITMGNWYRIALVIVLIVGVYLLYMGLTG